MSDGDGFRQQAVADAGAEGDTDAGHLAHAPAHPGIEPLGRAHPRPAQSLRQLAVAAAGAEVALRRFTHAFAHGVDGPGSHPCEWCAQLSLEPQSSARAET